MNKILLVLTVLMLVPMVVMAHGEEELDYDDYHMGMEDHGGGIGWFGMNMFWWYTSLLILVVVLVVVLFKNSKVEVKKK